MNARSLPSSGVKIMINFEVVRQMMRKTKLTAVIHVSRRQFGS